MKVEGLDTVVRDGITYLDFYTVSQCRDGITYSAHVTLSLRDLHAEVVAASANKTRRRKRGPLRITRAHASPPVVIDAAPARRPLPCPDPASCPTPIAPPSSPAC
jgi:hypothetical protein